MNNINNKMFSNYKQHFFLNTFLTFTTTNVTGKMKIDQRARGK